MNRCCADFVEKYFTRALTVFLKSQREFDQYLGQTLGLYGFPAMGRGWAEMMVGPFMQAFLADNGQPKAAEQSAARTPGPPAEEGNLRQVVDDLKQQLAQLRKELEER